jgi:hypothetical protein
LLLFFFSFSRWSSCHFQGCVDPDGFGLGYHRMSRRELDEPEHFARSTLAHAATAVSSEASGGGAAARPEDLSGAAQAGRQYKGLRGHQWWGFADATVGWTLAHCAAARDKVGLQNTPLQSSFPFLYFFASPGSLPCALRQRSAALFARCA